eukprot:TRINITY_DN16724_c0_g1_i3.p1 TRINITY_DN16724_c0_g1~~TRINITY_DN16724_c0_g1_i3.p1  ORF type:complete len:740 (+),score=103.91 TRINITY_DN16724_c0_g1_i3:32-2251(+)
MARWLNTTFKGFRWQGKLGYQPKGLPEQGFTPRGLLSNLHTQFRGLWPVAHRLMGQWAPSPLPPRPPPPLGEQLAAHFRETIPHPAFTNPRTVTIKQLSEVSLLGRTTARAQLRKHLLGTATYEKAVDNIITILHSPLHDRHKPVMYIVRGSGTGKTRSLEAIRMMLGQHEGILVLPITFNSRWLLTEAELSQTPTAIPTRAFLIATAIRMLATFYNIDMEDERLQCITNSTASGNEIIQHVIWHIVATTKRHRPVTAFLLMVDEASAAEDIITTFYGKEITDIAAQLRGALLNEEIVEGMHQGLLLAGLTMSASACTDSGRDTVAIEIPAEFDAKDIVDHMWCDLPLVQQLLADDPDNTKLVALRRLAAMTGGVPRIAELIGYLAGSPGVTTAWPGCLHHIIITTVKAIDARKFLQFPRSELLKRAFYQQPVPGDKETLSLVRMSVFTNQILRPYAYGAASTRPVPAQLNFLPQVNLFFLAAAARRQLSEATPSTACELALLRRCAKLLEPENFTSLGDPLEQAIRLWLEIKLLVLQCATDHRVQPSQIIPSLPQQEIVVEFPVEPICVTSLKSTSHKHFANLLKELDTIHTPSICATGPGEHCDVVLFLPAIPLVVLIDGKSRKESLETPSVQGRWLRYLLSYFRASKGEQQVSHEKNVQAMKLIKIIEEAKKKEFLCTPGSAAHALLAGRFVYLYFRSGDDYYVVEGADKRVRYLGRRALKEFFGPYFHIYTASRA